MSFDFMGEDLERPEVQAAYIELYDTTVLAAGDVSRTDALEEYVEAPYYEWAKENPVASFDFLKTLVGHESPAIRVLAGRIVSEWVPTHPNEVTEIMEKALDDESIAVAQAAQGVVAELLTEDTYVDERNGLGLHRLAKIARAYKNSRQSS